MNSVSQYFEHVCDLMFENAARGKERKGTLSIKSSSIEVLIRDNVN